VIYECETCIEDIPLGDSPLFTPDIKIKETIIRTLIIVIAECGIMVQFNRKNIIPFY